MLHSVQTLITLLGLLSFSVSGTAAESNEPLELGKDSAQLLEVVSHCTVQFKQIMSVSNRVRSVKLEKIGEDNTVYTITVQAGGYLGGAPLHDIAALRMTKTFVPDPIFVPSKPTTYDYTCDLSNLME